MKLLAKYWQRNVINDREFDEVEWYLRGDESVLRITVDPWQVPQVMYWNTYSEIGDTFVATVLMNAEEIDEINVSFLKWLYNDSHEGEYTDHYYNLIVRYDLLADLIDIHQGDGEEVREELLNDVL